MAVETDRRERRPPAVGTELPDSRVPLLAWAQARSADVSSYDKNKLCRCSATTMTLTISRTLANEGCDRRARQVVGLYRTVEFARS